MMVQVYDPVEVEHISAAEPMSTASMAVSWKATIPAPPVAAPQPVDPLDSDWVLISCNIHWKQNQWQPRTKIEDRKGNPKATEWPGYSEQFRVCTGNVQTWRWLLVVARSYCYLKPHDGIIFYSQRETRQGRLHLHQGIETTRATRDYLQRLLQIRKILH